MEKFSIDKTFIEDSFPVREVSQEGAKEKNIRHGHISTLHIWWARRPLVTSRGTNYACLIPAPKDDDEHLEKRNFIIELSKWENSLNDAIIKKAREDILKANGGIPPKVLDPFGGGGAIPLEALRLGCETYSNDYNPVAVLIQKCTLEYPQKYGRSIRKDVFGNDEVYNPLLEDVKKWGKWVLEEARKEIGRFYPVEEDGSIPVGYIWARTVPCQNPSCNAEIPLMRQFWLAKKNNKKVSLYPYVEDGEVKFKVVGDGYEEMPEDFDPSKGTISRAIVTCPVCGSMIEAKTTRKLFQDGKNGERLIAVVLTHPKERGKKYRIATEDDLKIFKEAEEYLEKKRDEFIDKWGIDPVPDEYLDWNSLKHRDVIRYGFKKWGDLFNTRQKLALITFMDKIREVYINTINEGYEKEYAKIISVYLGLALTKLAPKSSCVSTWHHGSENVERTLAKNSIPMQWEYPESNVIGNSGATGYFGNIAQIIDVLVNLTNESFEGRTIAKITHASAISLPYSDNFFDAVFTDPPYYDNIQYSELSDFFYVWLKRTIGGLYPELFSTMLTPKTQEIVANPARIGNGGEAKKFFEENIKKAFQEIYRVLKPNGIATIVYAHKTTEGWETVINALLDSGLVITASYPLNTEMKSRLIAKDSASLSSSIYIIARKMEREEIGFYAEVKEELKNHLNKRLVKLWEEGISGADFFISAIGSAIEVFGKYEQIMDVEGNIIRADVLLNDVREMVIEYTIKQILHNGFSKEISNLTKFYLLWRYNYGEAKVPFDEAKKLAQSIGIDLSKEWNKGFIKKEKEFIKLIPPQNRKMEDLEGSTELIDVLHLSLLLWEKDKREDLIKLLSETGYGDREVFYRVAQAISETLPNTSKEKKLLEGFLAGKERLMSSTRNIVDNKKLANGQQKLI